MLSMIITMIYIARQTSDVARTTTSLPTRLPALGSQSTTKHQPESKGRCEGACLFRRHALRRGLRGTWQIAPLVVVVDCWTEFNPTTRTDGAQRRTDGAQGRTTDTASGSGVSAARKRRYSSCTAVHGGCDAVEHARMRSIHSASASPSLLAAWRVREAWDGCWLLARRK